MALAMAISLPRLGGCGAAAAAARPCSFSSQHQQQQPLHLRCSTAASSSSSRIWAPKRHNGKQQGQAMRLLCCPSGAADSFIGTALDTGRLLCGSRSRWVMMRHGRRVPHLGRPADQRKALLRGLTTQLLRHGRIKTTQARAKALRKPAEHMITLAKAGTLHARRQALGYVYDKQLVHALFAEVPDRYGPRSGGYTRIIRTMPRRGDNAPMAFIELV